MTFPEMLEKREYAAYTYVINFERETENRPLSTTMYLWLRYPSARWDLFLLVA